MRPSLVIGAVAVAAVFGVVWWLAQAPRDPQAEPTPAGAAGETPREAGPVTAPPAPVPPERTRVDASKRPTAPDPRLALHMGNADDALVEYVAGADGRVILEIDDDPNSQGYRKPLREYLYAGDRVAGVTTYKYLGNQVQVIRAHVSYKPDGSVDEYREETEYRKPN